MLDVPHQNYVWEVRLLPKLKGRYQTSSIYSPNWIAWCWRGRLHEALERQQYAEYVMGYPSWIAKIKAF